MRTGIDRESGRILADSVAERRPRNKKAEPLAGDLVSAKRLGLCLLSTESRSRAENLADIWANVFRIRQRSPPVRSVVRAPRFELA